MNLLILHISLSLAGALVAATESAETVRRVVVFALTFGFAEAVVFGLLRVFSYKQRKAAERFEVKIQSVSNHAAREIAIAAIKAGAFHAVINTEGLSRTDLPDDVAEFFSEYAELRSPMGDVLRLGETRSDFVDVGESYDGARLLVRRDDGRLFEYDGDDSDLYSRRADYPSIYHWIGMSRE